MAQRAVFCAAAMMALAACTQAGDFGRPQPGVWTDTVAPWLGSQAAQARGEPVSAALLTDDERMLRDRAYHFLMPAEARSDVEAQVADNAARRILPASAAQRPVSAIYEAITAQPDRSPRVRYQRLREAMEGDRLLMGPFVALACRVREADRFRLRAADHLAPQDPSRMQAEARVAENRSLVDWVYAEMQARAAGYRYALEHLAVESPDRDAIRVERELIALESDRIGLERCAGGLVAVPAAPSAVVPRYTPHADKPPLLPK